MTKQPTPSHLRPPSQAPSRSRLELVESAEAQRWQSFYADRTRPVPFFEAGPDENLVEWVETKRIRPGVALDIGCGNGRNSVYLAKNGFVTSGVDLSEQAIAWASEQSAKSNVDVQWMCSSVFARPPAQGSVDFIYDSGCFHHLAPHQRCRYGELVAQALKSGGHFGLVCFAPEGGNGYTDEQVYERGSVGGGMGYSGDALRDFWSEYLAVIELRRMHEAVAGAGKFGRNFLWVMLATAQ